MIYPIYIVTVGDFLTVTSSKFHKSFGNFERRDFCYDGYTILKYDGINSTSNSFLKKKLVQPLHFFFKNLTNNIFYAKLFLCSN